MLKPVRQFAHEMEALFETQDEALMGRVKETADSVAFSTLVNRWEEPILRLLIRMVGDPHRAEDLKQETFVRLFTKRLKYRPSGSFSAFLWQIAVNICRDDMRRTNRRQGLFHQVNQGEHFPGWDAHPSDDPAPDEHVAQSEEGEIVRRALCSLPEIYRAVLVLRHYGCLKIRDIAATLNIPSGTVNSRMAEGMARLRRLLGPQFGISREMPG